MAKVSVIIPNYNHAPFLANRIKSVLEQTLGAIEVILLDDCSTDASVEIARGYELDNRKIKFIQNNENSGSPFIQWNKGISAASGKYIWIAESDDVAEDSLLEALVDKLEQNPRVALAYSQSYKMNSLGNITGSWIDWTDDLDQELFKEDFIMYGREYIERFLIHRNTIPNASAVLFRKSAYEQIGGADESIKNCSDWLTWLKILMQHDVAFVAKPLNYFRYHRDSVIAKAHLDKSLPTYVQYDKRMRVAFNDYLKSLNDSVHEIPTEKILKLNTHYIYKGVGNEGVFEIKSNNKFKGWKLIIEASLMEKFNLGLIKRAIKASFTS